MEQKERAKAFMMIWTWKNSCKDLVNIYTLIIDALLLCGHAAVSQSHVDNN